METDRYLFNGFALDGLEAFVDHGCGHLEIQRPVVPLSVESLIPLLQVMEVLVFIGLLDDHAEEEFGLGQILLLWMS